ncbi:MAG: GldM family protein [Bacteroidia bacterium]
MASNKETPRQKMISMMYLVLTALLALNVSDQVLQGFITVDESIDKSKQIITDNNKQIEKAFAAYVQAGNLEAKPYYEKCVEARTKIEKMVSYVDSMKYILISKTENTSRPDTAQLRFMKKLDDFDTPTMLFIGSDETHPKTEDYTAHDLRKNLVDLGDDLNKMVTEMQKKSQVDNFDALSLIEKIKTIQPVDRNSYKDGIRMNWELDNFYNIPTAAVITNFDKIQTDLKNVESELFRVFGASANKYLFKVDKLQAKVLAPSSYILSGEEFKADVLLSASSSQLTPDRMKVLVGAEYDPATNKLTMPGSPITVSEGIGKYQATGSTQGEQTFKGVIEYKNPKGTLDYYPFDYKYTVAAPFSAVGAENLNILYIGVDNPLVASAAGFAPKDLVVNVKGCGATIRSNGSGKYTLNATSTGTCYLTVSAKTPQGLKQQGAPKPFRVKAIPPPIAKINGKPVLSTLEMKSTELSTINYIGAVCLGFDFPVNAVVVEAVVSGINRNGEIREEKIKSAQLTANAKQILSSLGPGKRAFIEGIKVKINNQIVSAPDVIIKRKL